MKEVKQSGVEIISLILIAICKDRGRVPNFQASTQESIVNLLMPIREFLDSLVHPSARDDPRTTRRHVDFMAPRLCGSLLALGVFPVFLALRGVPRAVEFFVLAWTIVPIATVFFLS